MKKWKNKNYLKLTAWISLAVMFCTCSSIPIFANEKEEVLNVKESPIAQISYGNIILPNNSNYGTVLGFENREDSIKFMPNHNVSNIFCVSETEYKYVDERGLYESSVKVVEDGMTNSVRLMNEQAMSDIQIQMELPDNWTIDLYRDENNEVIDGSLVVYDDEGIVVAATTCPVAFDATGEEIDTYFYFNKNNLYQTVDDENAQYPLELGYKIVPVSSTDRFSDFFKSGEFITRDKKISLSLGERKFDTNVSYLVDRAWDTVVRDFYAVNEKWTSNLSGMEDQYKCHVNFAKNKVPWNLEPWRPDVGYVATVAARCNPE